MYVRPRRSTLAEVSRSETSLASLTRPRNLYGVKKLKIIVIVGPTSSGKSELAVKIARKIKGEIISADSRQVYKSMDIGTGKITRKEMKGVPHHLLDVSSPGKDFNVSHFKILAEDKIKDIIFRGKNPIIVGGTGFWIDALIYDFRLPEVAPDLKLRKKMASKKTDELYKILLKIDPRRAATIDSKNPHRLIRAIEIAKKLGQTPELEKKKRYKVIWLGLNPPLASLRAKIKKRLDSRLRAGLVGEVRKLRDSGISWKKLEAFGLEYRFVSRYLRGYLGYPEMREKLYKEICRYAKRQLTWFRKNKEIKWFSSPNPVAVPAERHKI